MLGHASLSTTQLYAQAAGMLDNSPAYALAALVSPPQQRLRDYQGETDA